MSRAVAIIPARGGSVRIPRKNIKLFHGRPIIEYSIETAKESGLFDDVVVSTDDGEIAMVASASGALVVMRSHDDGSKGTQEVARDVLDALHWLKATDVCVIYATSPLLTADDLHRGFEAYSQQGALFSMSVQASPLADAGCFYWGATAAFQTNTPLIAPHTAMVPMPPERVCDINTIEDWRRAESMFTALRRAHV